MAQLLMLRNGKTSTKEVKDSMHAAFSADPSYSLTQREVSDVMAELFVEQSWHREMNKNSVPNTMFYEYSEQPIQQAIVPATHAASGPATSPAAQPISTTIMAALDSANGGTVCYVSGQPMKYVQGNKPKNAMKHDCFQAFNDEVIGLSYNNLNVCSVDYFNKHKLL